jgi:hypothetical protein
MEGIKDLIKKNTRDIKEIFSLVMDSSPKHKTSRAPSLDASASGNTMGLINDL